jgi:hypothetical protein
MGHSTNSVNCPTASFIACELSDEPLVAVAGEQCSRSSPDRRPNDFSTALVAELFQNNSHRNNFGRDSSTAFTGIPVVCFIMNNSSRLAQHRTAEEISKQPIQQIPAPEKTVQVIMELFHNFFPAEGSTPRRFAGWYAPVGAAGACRMTTGWDATAKIAPDVSMS